MLKSQHQKPIHNARHHKKTKKHQKCILKHKKSLSTISNNNSNKQQIFPIFPTMKTSDNMALCSLPEYKSFENELNHSRLSNAEQFLSRIDNIFTHIPMPSVQTELHLKRAQLSVYQGKFNTSINSLEKALQILQTSLPFNNNTKSITPPASMSPMLSYPIIKSREKKEDDTQQNTDNTDDIVNKLTVGYNDTQLEQTYIPILTSLITLYTLKKDYKKASLLLSNWLTKFNPIEPESSSTSTPTGTPPLTTTKSVNGTILLKSLDGYIKQTQLTGVIRNFIINNDMVTVSKQYNAKNTNNNNDNTNVENEEPIKKEKPRFVLKTTSVVQKGQNDDNSNDKNDIKLETNDEILKKKQKQQEDSLMGKEQGQSVQSAPKTEENGVHNDEKRHKIEINKQFINLILDNTIEYDDNNDLSIENILDPLFLDELSNLPIKNGQNDDENHVSLFKSTLTSYLTTLNYINKQYNNTQNNNNHNNILKLHKTDVLSHIVTLFNTYKPLLINLKAKDSILEQYIKQLNKIETTYMYNNILGYETLPISSLYSHKNNKNAESSDNDDKISPIHITQAGVRLITTNMSNNSGSLIILNETLKIGDVLLQKLDNRYVLEQDAVQFFENIKNLKGYYLSPLLSSISQEYLSLNPVTSEGLSRTAIKYIEQQQQPTLTTFHTRQLLVDLYLNNAFITSNLSWNGKTRTKEAINIALLAEKMKNEFNNNQNQNNNTQGDNNNGDMMINPRYWDVKVKQIYNIDQNIKNNVDAMNDIETNPDNITNYEINFNPLPPHHEQWVFDKYLY